MDFHEVLSPETPFPCVIPVLLWYLGGFHCILMYCAGGTGYMSYVMMWGTRLGGRLGARPVRNAMSPCGSICGGGTGAASIVTSGVCTLGGVVSWGGGGVD